MRKLLEYFFVAIAVFLGTAGLMASRTNRIIKQWHQPEGIDYKSFDPYTLSVIERTIDWNNLSLPRRHILVVGRGNGAPRYGYFLDYSFRSGYEDVDDYIRRSNVEWTPEGLTFIEESGIRLFIPKARFIGGR